MTNPFLKCKEPSGSLIRAGVRDLLAFKRNAWAARYTFLMRFSPVLRAGSASLLIAAMCTQPAWGWGHVGHEMVDRLAAQYLPADVPAFLRSPAALDAMEYYGPEPDRWHNKAEKELRDQESPDHFIDMEYANLVGTFPRQRYDYIVAAQAMVAAH